MTTPPLTITVFADPVSVSPNRLTAKMHPMKKSRLKKEARNAARQAWLVAHKPRLPSPLIADVRIYRSGRRMDHDNAIASLKPYIDGLFNKAICDSDASLTIGLVTQIVGPEFKNRCRMEFIVTPGRERSETEEKRIYGQKGNAR